MIVTVFATGFGGYDPPVPDGAVNLVALNPLVRGPGSGS